MTKVMDFFSRIIEIAVIANIYIYIYLKPDCCYITFHRLFVLKTELVTPLHPWVWI
jgi:hypothetical protein